MSTPRLLSSCVVLLASLGWLAAAAGAQPRMVLDLNRRSMPTPVAAEPLLWTPAASYFAGTTADLGSELWSLDQQGIVRVVRDLNAAGSANPGGAVAFQGGLLLAADGQWIGREPWLVMPDGSATNLSVRSGLDGSQPREFTVAGGLAFFSAEDGVHGRELWVTDGTLQGTRMVVDLAPGSVSAAPTRLIALGSRVVFRADDGVAGAEPWISDGTAAGTTLLRDIAPGPAAGMLDVPAALVGNRVAFVAVDAAVGQEPWVTDGTAAGTSLLLDVYPGATGSDAHGLTTLSNGRVVFSANSPALGIEPWFSDGTAAGTRAFDLLPGVASSTARAFAPTDDGRCYMHAVGASVGLEVHLSDGTAAGTRVVDLAPSLDNTYLTQLVAIGTRAFFGTLNGALYVTDGTLVGTQSLLPTGVPFPRDYRPVRYGAGGILFVAGSQQTFGAWVSDGTPAGTRRAIDLNGAPATQSSGALVLGEITGRAVFAATDGTRTGLFASDGSAASTTFLADFAIETTSRSIAIRRRDSLLVLGAAVVRTDGTAAGTATLASLRLAFANNLPMAARLPDDRVLFVGQPQGANAELYVTDGTAAGTRAMQVVGSARDLRSSRDAVWFMLPGSDRNPGLWRSDGTTAGTRQVFAFSNLNLTPQLLGFAGSRAILSVSGTQLNLWSSDGVNTQVFATLAPVTNDSGAAIAAPLGERLVIAVTDGLVITDGTSAGTTRLLQLPRPAGRLTRLETLGDRVLACLHDPAASVIEPWSTDGTVAGTQSLARPLPANPLAEFVRVSADTVTLINHVGDNQVALRVTDGTVANTRSLGTLTAEVAGTVPRAVAVDGQLLFGWYHPVHGSELWAAEIGATAEPEGFGCGAASVDLTATAPWLGSTWTCTAQTTLPVAALLFGMASRPLPLVPGCQVHVETLGAAVLPLPPSGRVNLSIPLQFALIGVRLGAQAVAGPTAGLGIALSAGLRVTPR